MKEAARFLKMLGDETRLEILEFLLDGEKCVCQIFPKVKRAQSTVSIQLGKLEQAGLLKSRRDGKKVFYGIKDFRVCDVFKAIGFAKGKVLKRSCHINRDKE
ncbi:MAG: ArsR/SmtB family transcription factor [Candidatus Micrarchaeia archaeon]|jgi:ArsR family transcriptional regulator